MIHKHVAIKFLNNTISLWILRRDLFILIIILLVRNIHTYIIVQDYDLASCTTFVVCVNLRHAWQDQRFQVNSEWQTFKKHFMAILFILRIFVLNRLRVNRRRNIFSYFFDLWSGLWIVALHLISQHNTH